MTYFLLIFGAIVTNNIVLSQFQGCCPFLGVSKKESTAIGMGCAVIFVMAISSIVTYAVYYYILVPLNIEFMRTMAFILVIASLVQITEMVIKRFSPTLYKALGVYLPLITTNCAVLGTATSIIFAEYNLIESFLASVATGAGFLLAILILAGIRQKIAQSDIPKPFRGFPITLLAAAIMALAFAGFTGMFTSL